MWPDWAKQQSSHLVTLYPGDFFRPNTTEQLSNSLKKHFGQNNVFVATYLIKPKSMYMEYSQLLYESTIILFSIFYLFWKDWVNEK